MTKLAKNRWQNKLFVLTTLATSVLSQVDDTPIFNTLQGAFYQETTTTTGGLQYLSMAGGAPISFQGSNLNFMAEMNTLIFDSNNLQNLHIQGPPLSPNDQFNSNGMAGYLGYTSPSVMELFKTDFDSFNGKVLPNGVSPPIDFTVKVSNPDGYYVACATAASCLVRYSRDYTPYLYAVTPANVYKDQIVEFQVNPKSTQNNLGTPADQWPFREIRLGQTLVWWSDGELQGTVTQDQRLPGFVISPIDTKCGDQAPTKNSEPRLLFYPGYALNMPTSQTCNFAGDDCWTVRTHPKIESISGSSGFISGGQNLTISGWGLNGTDISVLVDNVPCKVFTNQTDSITCLTGPTTADSKTYPRPGQPGLKRDKYKAADGISTWFGAFAGGVYPLLETNLMTSFEAYRMNQDTQYEQKLSGWFKAPATAQYRFYMASDDSCRLYLDSANPFDEANPKTPNATMIAYRYGATNWREYFFENGAQTLTPSQNDKHISDWITLSEGKYYYIEGQHIQYGGGEHFSVSVEIQLPDGNPANHPKANPQFQTISIDPVNQYEQWQYVIKNPDNGNYQLNFLNPTTTPPSYWTSPVISVKASAQTVFNAINWYFANYFGSNCKVTQTMYDANAQITTNASLATSYVYNITLLRLITGVSVKAATAKSIGTNSTFTFTPPSLAIQSSLPLNGSYTIQCTDQLGNKFTTVDIAYNTNYVWVQNTITNSIPFLADKVEVMNSYKYDYFENGVSWILKFSGIQGDVAPCVIQSGVNTTLVGTSVTYNQNITKPFNKTLMFEPIPLEFLSSNDQQPQVLIKVNGLEALCANLTCDYQYFTGNSSLTSQTLNYPSLQIQGVQIPFAEITQVIYGTVACIVQSANDTTINCELIDFPLAGAWRAEVYTLEGMISNTAIVLDTPAPLQITSVTPTTGLNYLGGDNIVIIGSGFGYDLANINVTFDSGTYCTAIGVISTGIVCQTQRFDAASIERSRNGTIGLIITVNGVSDNSTQVTLIPQAQVSVSITPNRLSPVLKANVNISLASNYSGDMNASSFTVYLSNNNAPENITNLYVISTHTPTKTILVKFPGARSGNYTVFVKSVDHGFIDTDAYNITVIGQVTNISPTYGSIYGGTIITITGENFSDNILDNPVKVGDSYCDVLTTNSTTITCQLPLLSNQAVGPQPLLVFLKTSEEAFCGDSSNVDCEFTFQSPASTITNATASWDSISQTYKVIVDGTGLDATTQLVLDGITQQFDSFTSTQASFTIVDLDDTFVTDLEVVTSEGYPQGQGSVSLLSLELNPEIISIDPPVGSSGGTILNVTGAGFGVNTQGLNLVRSDTNQTICEKVKVLGYGSFKCQTLPGLIPNDTALRIQAIQNNVTVSSSNSLVTYSQVDNFLVTDATISNQTIVFTGSTTIDPSIFQTCEFHATFGGVDSTLVTIVDANTFIADFTKYGIPTVSGVPKLLCALGPVGYFATVSSTVTLSKNLTIASVSGATVCSYAGGCELQINADGLTAALVNTNNSISVCGNPCSVKFNSSNSQTTVCEVPSLATTYSVQNYKLKTVGTLNGTLFPNDTTLYDGKLQIDHVDTSKTTCTFGMSFPQGTVAVLDEAKVFINWLTNPSIYVNNLSFEGSNDNWSTFDSIAVFGSDIHEGWNYLNFRNKGNAKPAYNSYRFKGAVAGSCRVTEFRLTGVQTIEDLQPQHTCVPTITVGGIQQTSGVITYQATATPTLSSISPRFGSVLGGDTITLTGENFDANATYTVFFDKRPCNVTSSNDTQIVCVTSNKPWVPDTPLVEIYSSTQGLVATKGLVFRYVSLWSEPSTWGFDIPPQAGESVSVPKGQHLLVDVDSTPVLFAIVVEGSLIFAPDDNDHHKLKTFDATYIMVEGGYLEVGTQDFPYTSQLIITMHGTKYSPYLPMYGNKMIACRFCQLEMWGVTRNVTWTTMNQTANIGDDFIILNEYTDWQIGEEIVIPGTVYGNNQTETRHIAGVNGTTIYLDSPLEYQHLSVIKNFGGIDMPMQDEVGLLTRNVLFRGDPETSIPNQYGAHIMVSSPGDDSSIGHICYIELQYVGQAFQLGRYPIHFHMIGNIYESYVIGNAIHDTYNRAVTTHGVHYFTVEDNVSYNTMGHTFFIEDAVETNNYYNHNLAVNVKESMSLLNTDTWPAGFWITHPNNIFTNNHVAGSDKFGFWFEMQMHSTGPSTDVNVCPMGSKLGQFTNNTVHSAFWYGLRIFHGLLPRTYPCQPVVYDGDYVSKGKTDPYWQNPLIPAIFEDSVFWRNGKVGAIMEQAGYCVFKNLKSADNGMAGMEWSLSGNAAEGYAKIQGGLVVGDTQADDFSPQIRNLTVQGIITPRSENFTVQDVTFYNYDFKQSTAFGTCSHCWHPAATDSGARTINVKNLTFDDATVPRRIDWQIPHKDIFYDMDGSFSGLTPGSWVMPYWGHLVQPECQVNLTVFNGIVCNSSVQVRRVAFFGSKPTGLLKGMALKIAKWDDQIAANVTSTNQSLWNFQQNLNQDYTNLPQRPKQDPGDNWVAPFVTGHKYRISWGWANDFEEMQIQVSDRWLETDKNIHFITNFTDQRIAMNLTNLKGLKGKSLQIMNETYLNKTEDQLMCGDNVIFNQTEVREFRFVINGKNISNGGHNITIKAIKPPMAVVAEVALNQTQVLWSDPNSWDSKKIPVEGDDTVVKAGVNMILDIDTPILKSLVINGALTFLQNDTTPINLTLNAYTIFIYSGGQLKIGNSTNPFNGIATVKLYGNPNNQTIAFDPVIVGGNKVLANLGLLAFYGASRSRNSRLLQPAYKGDSSVLVSPTLDWKAGDIVYLAPTATQYTHSDYRTISAYNNQTGELNFTQPLKYYHWGDFSSTADNYNGVDMRGEVILLSRNVRVVGNDSDSWGGQIVTADVVDPAGNFQAGQLLFNNVEVYNCSQANTFNAAIRFDNAQTKYHEVNNTVVHQGWGWSLSVYQSSNVYVKNSDFVGARALGTVVQTSKNVTLDGIFQGDVMLRPEFDSTKEKDIESCFSICAYQKVPDICSDVSLINSIGAGCHYAGFVVPGHDCGLSATQKSFRNNVAHSIEGAGAHIFPNPALPKSSVCYEGSYFAAYKVTEHSLSTFFISQNHNMTQITSIDCTLGINLQASAEIQDKYIKLNNAYIYGETKALDCPPKPHNCYCEDKIGFYLFGGHEGKKQPHETASSMLPFYKIKSSGTYRSFAELDKITFSNFLSNTTACGMNQVIFNRNHYSWEWIPKHTFTNTRFVDVVDSAFAFLQGAVPESQNLDNGCPGMICTGAQNVVLAHSGVTYDGVTPSQKPQKFQLLTNNPGATNALKGCKFNEPWNAWMCSNDYIGLLQMRSLDADQKARNVAPVYVMKNETGFINTVNSMANHKWDGFYSGNEHKSFFPIVIEAFGNYTIHFTGAASQRVNYYLDTQQGAIKVRIDYSGAGNTAGSYQVLVNGQVVPYTPWDKNLGSQAPITGYKGCGENRWMGVDNYLEFWLEAGCEVTVQPVDAIKCNVRLQWTLSEFYAKGGVVSFTDRVAAALGIQAYQIKTVAVYVGSVIVNYYVTAADGDLKSNETLANIQTQLNVLVASNDTSVWGAPVLDATTAGKVVASSAPPGKPNIFDKQIIAPVVTQTAAPIIQAAPLVKTGYQQQVTAPQVTVSSGSPSGTSVTVQVVVIIIVVLVVAVVGVSAVMYFRGKNKKVQEAETQKKQVVPSEGVLVSEIELNPQFHIDPANIDIDIFTNKKRALKKMNDDEVTTKYYQDTSMQFNSETKMHVTGVDLSTKQFVARGAEQN